MTASVGPVPYWPTAWYVVARSSELAAGGIVAVRLGGREVVIARLLDGSLLALDAHCPHMGAHLRRGRVSARGIVCALHAFEVDRRGLLLDGAGREHRSECWRAAERFGLVFVALGDTRLPLPDPPGGYRWTTAAPVTLNADWRNMIANAFDMEHLCNVHARTLVEPYQCGEDSSGRAYISYRSRVTGRGTSDLLMKWISGDSIRARMTCAGPVLMVETDLGRTQTAAVLGVLPGDGSARAFGAFGIRNGLLGGLTVNLARWLFIAFLKRDFRVVEEMRFRQDVDDTGLKALYAHLGALPAADACASRC